MASLFIVTSVAYANPVQNDIGFAFGDSVKAGSVMVLDEAQMGEVQGKGWKKRYKKAKRHYKNNRKKYNFAGKVAVSVVLAPTGATGYYYAGAVVSAGVSTYL